MAAAVGAALLVAGLVSGAAAVAVHQRWWGLSLALAALVATVAALPRGWWARPPFALGWVVVVVTAALPRAEGDFLLAADLAGYALLVASGVLLVAALVSIPVGASPVRADHGPPRPSS